MPSLLPPSGVPYRGYGGWLSFFGAVQVTVVPLVQIVFLAFSLLNEKNDPQFSRLYPRAVFLMKLESIVALGITGFGVYGVILLRRLRPGAVRLIKRYLVTCLAFSFLGLFFPLLYDVPSQATTAWMQDRFGPVAVFVRTLVGFAIWFSYFNVSKRVKATFPNG